MAYTTIELPNEQQNLCSAHIDAAWVRQATIAAIDREMAQVYQFIREEIEKGNFSVMVDLDNTEEAFKSQNCLRGISF